ncbi:NUDIX hydrolase [Streptomyces puniciscabiei]
MRRSGEGREAEAAEAVEEEEPEYLDVVDEHDRVVGRDTRANIHRKHLIHRGVHVLVVNRLGEILVQERAAHLDNHPGLLDASAGGHVHTGETYRQAAGRELLEELGCHTAPVRYLLTYDGYSVRQFEKRAVFVHHCDGPFRPDPDAVAGVAFHTPERLTEVFATRPCTEGFMRSVSHYFDHLAAQGTPTPLWRWPGKPPPYFGQRSISPSR